MAARSKGAAMISSEVQRTLVKSPPELWAELSDPDALARHLGELGEIRITRSRPEELVEWKSDSASGTIAIKPSGWGTRVTLTAARELPPDEAGESPAPGEAGQVAEPRGAGEAGQVAETRAAGQVADGEEPSNATGAAAVSVEPWATEPDSSVEASEPADPMTSSEAAVPAMAEPSLEVSADPEPEPESEPEAAAEPESSVEATALPPATPAGAMSAWAQQEAEAVRAPAEAPAQATATVVPAHEYTGGPARPAPSERRGFFARLFGRRSRPKPTLATGEDLGSDTELTIAREAARRRLEAMLAMPDREQATSASEDELAAAAPDHRAPEPDAAEAQMVEPELVEAELAEADMAEPQLAEDEMLEPELAESEMAAPGMAAPESIDVAGPPGMGAIDAEPAEGFQAFDTPGPPQGPEPAAPEAWHGEEPARAVAGAASELSAELRAAEETAAEEVTAVLTAVLDRLGAAHHRPFSRG